MTGVWSQMGTQALDSVSSALPTSSAGLDSHVPSAVETLPKQESDGKINIYQELRVMGLEIGAPPPAAVGAVIPGAVLWPSPGSENHGVRASGLGRSASVFNGMSGRCLWF